MAASEAILATLKEQRKVLSRRYPIRRLALFGSWARGDARQETSSKGPWGAGWIWSPDGPSSPRCGKGSSRSSSMPERDPDLLIEDILAAIGKIERYTSGMDQAPLRWLAPMPSAGKKVIVQ